MEHGEVTDRQLEALLARLDGLPLPLLVGILPLESSRHAEFLHNEVPGVTVPDRVRARLRRAKEGAPVGLELALECLATVCERVAGVYLIPPNGRLEPVVELLRQARALAQRQARAPAR